MTVRELIEKLLKMPKDARVILADNDDYVYNISDIYNGPSHTVIRFVWEPNLNL